MLVRAAQSAERVAAVFVFDDTIRGGSYAAPNRVQYLLDALADLRRGLRELGAGLVVRRGDWVREVAALAAEIDAAEVHVSADASGYAGRRLRRLGDALGRRELHPHDDVVTAVPPGAVTPTGGDHFAVFTPYHRRWAEQPLRRPLLP